jgi:cytochrome c6
MKKSLMTIAVLVAVSLCATTGICDSKKRERSKGEKGFDMFCAGCHPQGGNIITPRKPLSGKSLRANGIKNAQGIIDKMRHPGGSMYPFDEKVISNEDAKAIADYILKTFNN